MVVELPQCTILANEKMGIGYQGLFFVDSDNTSIQTFNGKLFMGTITKYLIVGNDLYLKERMF